MPKTMYFGGFLKSHIMTKALTTINNQIDLNVFIQQMEASEDE